LKAPLRGDETKQTETITNTTVAAYPTGMLVVEHQDLDAAPGSANHWVLPATLNSPAM
jgi:hypothetical protein